MTKSIKSIIDYSGLSTSILEVECNITNGLPSILIIGDVSKAVDEARERLRASFINSSINLPKKRITISLFPADIPKTSTSLDLPMAISLLAKSDQINMDVAKDYLFLGELSLEGKLNPVRGIVGKILAAKSKGLNHFYIPKENLHQAMIVPGIFIKAPSNLKDAFLDLSGTLPLKINFSGNGLGELTASPAAYIDFSEIAGQSVAKRALEIAAAGHHNVLLDGPPGTGKTMLAKALCGILPNLNQSEILEVTHLHSLCNSSFSSIVTARPFRSPHHTASSTALIGGGTNPKPGEATLAHRGVLFLDELPEFSHSCLEALRQPLEDRTITISRVKDSASYPADFILAATQNPCPCGFYGTSRQCVCSPSSIYKYQKKISGPILDRFDLYIPVNQIEHHKLLSKSADSKQSLSIRSRIEKAYKIQYKRFNEIRYNNSMSNSEVRQFAGLDLKAKEFLDSASSKLSLSARGYIRTIKVARTIADLAEEKNILIKHLSEALQYRQKTGRLA